MGYMLTDRKLDKRIVFMARRKKRNVTKGRMTSAQRGLHKITERRNPLLRRHRLELDLGPDRRFFNDKLAKTTNGRIARFKIYTPENKVSIREGTNRIRPDYTALQFANPQRVNVCRRRKKRREVLFKKGRIGKGKKVSPIRRRNRYSNVRC